MTNEEAKIIIGNIPIKPEVLDDCYDITEYQEAKAMAIKALEQQPSEDCISRQKALDCFEQTNTRQGAKYAIETLPSVTPQRPKGKWIDICVIKSFHYDGEPRVRCSRCENEEEWSSNYCPNCGADMSGGAEDD